MCHYLLTQYASCADVHYRVLVKWTLLFAVASESPPHHVCFISCLARSAKLTTGLYILLALNSYFFSSSFLMISRRQIISGSAGPIFAIFSLNESILGADDRSGPLLSISQGTLPWQPILWKNGKLCTFVALAFRNGMGYRCLNVRINSANDTFISCENFVKFGPVTAELTGLICERLVRYGQKMAYLVNISGSTGPIFAIITP